MATKFFRIFWLAIVLSVLSFAAYSFDIFSLFTDDPASISAEQQTEPPLQVPPSMPDSQHGAEVPERKGRAQEPEPAISLNNDQENAKALVPEVQSGAFGNAVRDDTTGEEKALVPDAALVPSVQNADAEAESEASGESEDVIKGTINRGDTVSKLLGEVADNNVVQDYIDATRRVFPLTAFRAGQPYVLVCDVESGTVKRFEYEIDNKRRLIVEGEQPVARVEAIEYDVRLARIEARIDSNLFQSVADIGESPLLAITLANLFGWEINFIRDLQEGDSFQVLVEKNYREGSFRGYGRVLGATFSNKGKTFEAFLFHNGQNSTQHFNAKGENLKKVLLQAPLSFTRLTSRFSKSRKHPIFGNNRPHLGVDYGAPTGTPVKAVGEGTVSVRGWVGGYGNQIALRHAAGLESMYSHLSGFARGLQKGQKVRQGQVIGYVGSTGQSTGPHLDFRLKQGGKFVDPTKAINPRSASVYKRFNAEFDTRMKLVREYLSGSRSTENYSAESIFSPSAPMKNIAAEDEPRNTKKGLKNK